MAFLRCILYCLSCQLPPFVAKVQAVISIDLSFASSYRGSLCMHYRRQYMKLPWKWLWITHENTYNLTQDFKKFHGCMLLTPVKSLQCHEITKKMWSGDVSHGMKQLMVYHELIFMVYVIGWSNISWKHHRIFMV